EDKHEIKRAAAGAALALSGDKESKTAVRALLKDPVPLVRLRVALGLLEQKEKDSIPTLISLVTEAPKDHVWRIEDALYLIAGEGTPNLTGGLDDASRRKNRELWQEWWRTKGAALDLAKLDLAQRHLGYTLVAMRDRTIGPGGVTYKICELDRDKNVRWKIE